MPILSTLRAPAIAGVRSAVSAASKGNVASTNMMQVRHGGGAHKTMVIKPSTYNRDRFKDDFYFFITLGVVPLALFVTYLNVRYGPAELQDVPDDYVPQSWEYYKDPVSRFMAKYRFKNSHAKEYERHIYFLNKANQQRLDTLKLKKVKHHMASAPTQREWYLVPDTLEDRRRYQEKVKERTEKGMNVNKWL